MSADSRVLIGDSRLSLRGLPAAHYHAVVTSPPFYRLRDYQAEGQIGMEATPELYLQRLVETFREVRRVLRPDGVLWLNLGDSYASDGARGASSARTGDKNAAPLQKCKAAVVPPGLQPLDLLGMPFRLAFALQADGWLLRGDVVWAKKNPMPESISGWRWERCRVKVRGGLRGKEPARSAHHGRAQHRPRGPRRAVPRPHRRPGARALRPVRARHLRLRHRGQRLARVLARHAAHDHRAHAAGRPRADRTRSGMKFTVLTLDAAHRIGAWEEDSGIRLTPDQRGALLSRLLAREDGDAGAAPPSTSEARS